MAFKDWLQPRVLISGGIGLLLAFLISWLSGPQAAAYVQCRPTKEILWIKLNSSSEVFSVPVCKGQKVGWTGDNNYTVKFDANNIGCTSLTKFSVKDACPAGPAPLSKYCSQTDTIKQPGSWFSSVYGQCDYAVDDGITDPRVIVIGK
jgi:hypothetical protein